MYRIARLLASSPEMAQWEWQGGGQWQVFEPVVAASLERTFVGGGGRVDIDSERFVDLAAMQQCRHDDPRRRRSVRRVAVASPATAQLPAATTLPAANPGQAAAASAPPVAPGVSGTKKRARAPAADDQRHAASATAVPAGAAPTPAKSPRLAPTPPKQSTLSQFFHRGQATSAPGRPAAGPVTAPRLPEATGPLIYIGRRKPSAAAAGSTADATVAGGYGEWAATDATDDDWNDIRDGER